MNGKNKIEIKTAADSLCLSAIEDIDNRVFDEAAHTILFIVVAFGINENNLSLITEELDALNIEDSDVFYKLLFKQIEWANSIIKHDCFEEGEVNRNKQRLYFFIKKLSLALSAKAKKLFGHKKYQQSFQYLEYSLELSFKTDKIEYVRSSFMDKVSVAISGEIQRLKTDKYWFSTFIDTKNINIDFIYNKILEGSQYLSGMPEFGNLPARGPQIDSVDNNTPIDGSSTCIELETKNMFIEIKKGMYAAKVIIRPKKLFDKYIQAIEK